MLPLGADPPSLIARCWCFILLAVSGAPHSPVGGRFYIWEGRAAGRPKESSAASLGVDTSLLPAPHGFCANKQPALVPGLGTFHEATEFTGEK